MKNVLALVGAALVAFLALGWYLGWYQISSLPSPNGKQAIHVDINSDKVTNDVKTGVEKGEQIVDQIREKKSDPQGTPGPASNFFTPTSNEKPKDGGSGWKPIGNKPQENDGGAFGLRVPKN
jgi:hypothetical protein